jgi:DNA-binding FadR family transcriptional regulator
MDNPAAPPNTPPRKMAEELAGQIESLIMAERWPEGKILGSETDLIERFGVSRAVFREAVRLVEHHGAARMRRGPKGGLLVTAPQVSAVIRPTTLYLDYADVPTSDLIAARTALELNSVAAVAERMDDDAAERLRSALAIEQDAGAHGAQMGTAHDFHVLLAELSGNAALRLFIETLASLTFERTRHLPFDEEQMAESTRAHGMIVDAVISGDSPRAQYLMRRHLGAALAGYTRRGVDEPQNRAAAD